MVYYKNISNSAKTFYGVRFESGDIKGVKGYINDPFMIRIFDPVIPEPVIPEPVLEVRPESIDNPIDIVSKEQPAPTSKKRKKSNESEKDLIAEKQEIKITSEEETTDGN